MKGTEKIIEHIRADADAGAKAVLDAAKAEADAIVAAGWTAAEAEYARIKDAAKAECAELIARRRRMAEMESKKDVLAVKQELISSVFDKAQSLIESLPDAEYEAFLARLAANAAGYGTEELVFNERDKKRCSAGVMKAANRLLRERGVHGGLTVSEDTANIPGGVIVRHGGIEVNCGIETLVAQEKGSMSAQIADKLFS